MGTRSRTLRSTLTLWLEIACAGALLTLGTGLVLERRASYRGERDAALAADAAGLVARLAEEDVARSPGEALRAALPAAGGDGFCALRSERGEVLAAWNVAPTEHLPPVSGATLAGPLQPAFASLPSGRTGAPEAAANLRLVTLPFRDHEHLYFLQLARSERSWIGALGELVAPLLLGALVLGLAAWLAAQLIVRRALSPLGALAEAARTLSPNNLGGRFRVLATDVELRRLEEELNAALQRLEEGFRSQAQFASNVAHELKTPLAALVTDAQVSRIGGRDPEKSLAFMDRAEEELKHLSELVESFLVMARVDAGYGRMDLVYVDDVIRRAVRHCAAVAEASGVRMKLQLASSTDTCDPFVRGDGQLLQAMVENLLRNALHSSPRAGVVVVETSFGPEKVQISVRDNGPGIPEELRRSVLQRGVRATGRGRESNGAGLGLAIVNSVAQLHVGSVVVEQNVGGGCVVVVTLPAARKKDETPSRCAPKR